ncbi:MAG: hypothetical protein ACI83P_001599, partial [Janthinobacterium sp.]
MAIAGKMQVIRQTSLPHMNTTQRPLIMQRWQVVQF